MGTGTPSTPHMSVQQPNTHVYGGNMNTNQMGVYQPHPLENQEIQLKNKFVKLVSRNPDILPEGFRSKYNFWNNLRIFTNVGLFTYFFLSMNSVAAQGLDSRSRYYPFFKFILLYIGFSTFYSIQEGRIFK